MPPYLKSQYKLIGFEKSKTKNKKYDAIITNKYGEQNNNKKYRIPFGDIRYEHYKDTTPNKIYSNKDHNDKRRRESYRKRHKVYLKDNEYTPAYFSWHYLW